MSRMVGTVSRGVRAPIIRSGDDLVEIVTKSVLEAAAQPEDGFAIRDRDVVAMTEAIVARAQGNYASVDDIAAVLTLLFVKGHINGHAPADKLPKQKFPCQSDVFFKRKFILQGNFKTVCKLGVLTTLGFFNCVP